MLTVKNETKKESSVNCILGISIRLASGDSSGGSWKFLLLESVGKISGYHNHNPEKLQKIFVYFY